MTKHNDSKRYVPIKHNDSKRYVSIWDLRGSGHVRRARRPDAWSPGAANRTKNKKQEFERNVHTGWSPPSPMHCKPRQSVFLLLSYTFTVCIKIRISNSMA